MRWFAVAAAVLSLGTFGVAQRKPEVQVLEAKARRDDGKILVDSRVRVTAAKPIRGLVIVFDLMAPENNVVGQERICRSETGEHVRAVRFKIRAFDLGERDLRVGNSGPFPIE
jgi:hypothetical protein